MRIYDSTYKDLRAVALESPRLLAMFLPDNGGKMACFRWKETGAELLVQAEGSSYKGLEYDGDYVAAECSGFDDMFPTIDQAYYEGYPWKGVAMPDHGEVCGLPWDYLILPESLYLKVHGVRFPYQMEKWISFPTENEMKIQYKLTNLSPFDMDFIWAGHIMINAEEGGEIVLPYKIGSTARCVFSWDRDFAKFGDCLSWPETGRKDGRLQRLDITPSKNQRGNNYKYYFTETLPEGWCGYRYRSVPIQLKISLPKEQVPYLGIWVNEGSFKQYYNLALEPCTGTFDQPAMAAKYGQKSVLRGKGEHEWFLNFAVDTI